MSNRSLSLVLSLACLALGGPLAAQDAPPVAGPGAPAAPKAPAAPTRDDHLKALEKTVVHFDFARAPLPDVASALQAASGVPVEVGKAARRVLDKRKFRLKYVADRTGVQVLTDLAKAAALDWEVTDVGAVIDTAGALKALRAKLGLPARTLRLSPADVAKMLETKRLSLSVREQPLPAVLDFLRRETGVRYVLVRSDPEAAPPKVTLAVTSVALGDLLDQVLAPHGLAWMRQGNVVLIDAVDVIARQKQRPPAGEEGEGDGEAGGEDGDPAPDVPDAPAGG